MDYAINNRKFIKRWLLFGFLVWVLAVLFCIPGIFVLGVLSNLFYPSSYSPFYELVDMLIGGAGLLYIGGAIGMAVGILQKTIINEVLYFNLRRWQLMSVIGGALGGILTFIAMNFVDSTSSYYYYRAYYWGVNVYPLLSTITPMLVFITIVSLFQAYELRRYVNNAWLWVFANVIGGLVFGATAFYTDSVLILVLPIFAQAGITGGMMLWLFQTSVRGDVDFVEV